MSTDTTKKSTATFKFLIVGVATLTFVGLSLFFLSTNLNGIQKLIEREVTKHYQTMTLNYPLEQVIFDLEKDIHQITEDHFHAPQGTEILSREVLEKVIRLKQIFNRQKTADQKDNRLEVLDLYEVIFKDFIAQNRTITSILFDLEELRVLFLEQLDSMEQKTGAKMVEFTLAGKDTTVLRQMFAIIPFCREQVLIASYSIATESFNHSNHHELDKVQTLALDAFTSLGQALDTLTSGFVKISPHANLLLEKIPDYRTKVIKLQDAIRRHKKVQNDLETTREALVGVLNQSRENMLKDMDLLQDATHQLSQRALMITFWVSLLVLGALALAWLILQRVGQRAERGMLEAIKLKQELEAKNTALMHEISAREMEEKTRKQLEAQLQQSLKMEAIGTLAGGIAHDFNNILAAMLGYTELASMRMVQGRDTSREINEIKKAGMRAQKLTQQILAFSRSSERNFAPLQIALIVEEAIKLLQSTLPTTIAISLRMPEQPETLVVMADQTQIHQIIMNLCTNAFHAMRNEGGKLEVLLDRVEHCAPEAHPDEEGLPSGSYVQILVRDNGCGIEPKAKGRIFEPYFTTKDRGEGTGMGLAVVHGIVRIHNGGISCVSELGVGTSFEVLLPLVTEVSDVDEPQATAALIGGNERILFVDDEAVIVEVNEELLRSIGYQVTTAVSSTKALELFEANPDQFDLVITDMTMPELTGAALAVKILAIRPEMPILMCTGFSDQIDEEKAFAIGIRGFLLKPVNLKKLTSNIRQLLDQT